MWNANFLLELFNGSAAILETIFLLWALRYLWLESRRRGLSLWQWFQFPPSMGLVVAIIVFDFAELMRSATLWSWRWFYHAKELAHWQYVVIVLAGLLTVIGGLCKIRAVTRPDQGDEPWLVCLVIVLIFVLASFFARKNQLG